MIPFQPEPLHALKQRYPDALLVEWVVDKNMKDTPGKHREHVFDTQEGLRFIISKDTNNKDVYVHFSVSQDSYQFINGRNLFKDIYRIYFELSGVGQNKITFVRFSDDGVPHFIHSA